MDGRTMLGQLGSLCRSLDRGGPLFRIEWARVVAPIAVGITMGVAGCDDGTQQVAAYGAPPMPATELNCTGGFDDDQDGLVDCADPDCAGNAVCAPAPAYGIPFPPREQLCADGLDDDRDGLADCGDPDCAGNPACIQPTLYAAPMPMPQAIMPPMPARELDCTNGVDDDRDGQTDCSDPDCTTTPACPAPRYIAPMPMPPANLPAMEQACADGVDDDHDGQTDCSDPDCASNPACAVARYGAPLPR